MNSFSYIPTIATRLAPSAILFLTILSLLTHAARTLLSPRLGRRQRFALTWATPAALIVGDTTRPPTSTTDDDDMRVAVPTPSALLIAGGIPLLLLLLDEAIASFARRRRRAGQPMTRWGEALLATAMGFDVLFVVQAVIAARFAPEGALRHDHQRQKAAMGGHPMMGFEEMDRARDEYWYLGHDSRLMLALLHGHWRQLVGHAIMAASLVPGWYLTHKMFGVEPDVRDVPVFGGWVERFLGPGEGDRPLVWKDVFMFIGVDFALNVCFFMWAAGVWAWWTGAAL